ncbi:SDR family oxidoreductase, partial [Bordetella pertussis]|uniref:SDR family oxidoreductase n=1 Tax=Bordetella pertussis TaxID=520 RepID=UPI0021CB8DC1
GAPTPTPPTRPMPGRSARPWPGPPPTCELGPRGITANVVHPGPIDTDMNPAGTDQAAALVQMLAVPHYGEPADIANMVAYLAGPQARYVTGAELSVDGGYAA